MTKRLVLLALTAMATGLHAATPLFVDATAADSFKVYWLIKAETAPVIDGKLDDAVWQEAEPLADWGTTNYGRQIKPEIVPGEIDCRAAWDDTYLYISARCYHKLHPNDMTELRSKISNLGAAIYARECLEIHIDGNLDHATRFQSIVNPLAEKMMIWYYDFGWGILQNQDYGLDADWDVAAAVEKDHWTVEVRYALTDIQVEPEVGTMLGINPCWFNWADSKAADGKTYWWQYVTWSTHDDSHHDPRLFGRFILVDRKPKALEDGLRLAFPDLEEHSLMIQTAEGLLIFRDGKSELVTYGTQVRQEAQTARAALDRIRELLGGGPTSHSGHITDKVIPEQEQALVKMEAALASRDKLSRGTLAAFRKELATIAGTLDDAYWRVKQDALLTGLE